MLATIYKYGLFIALLAVLTLVNWYLPPILWQQPNLQAGELGGSFSNAPAPTLWPRTWLNGEYQKRLEQHLKQESEISPFLVRSRNQMIFSIFNEIPTPEVIKGNAGYFYNSHYCEAYIGRDQIPQDQLDTFAKKAQEVQQLLEKKGKQLLVLLPPSKPRALPSFLPGFYKKNGSKFSNYDRFRFLLEDNHVPNLDFSFFLSAADAAPYPVYPKYGLHWSYYGVTIAADTIRQKIGTLLHKNLPEMQWHDRIEPRKDYLGTDRELLNGANIWESENLEPMPYPDIQYQYQDSLHFKPVVLSVGDSFYKQMYDYGIPQGLFHPNSKFWYYFTTSYPKQSLPPTKEELEKIIADTDIVILQHAEINIPRFGFGFLDQLLEVLKSEEN